MARLTTFEQLNETMSQLHDCSMDLDKAVFDRAAHEWRGTFLRPLWESPAAIHERRALIIVDSRMPVAEGILCFRHVTDVRVLNDQRIGIYTLNKAKRRAGGLCLCFNEALELEILFEDILDATYDERPLPGYTAVYRQYLFAQTGPEIEFARPAP